MKLAPEALADGLAALGIPSALHDFYTRLVQGELKRLDGDEAVFLVINAKGHYLTSLATPSIEGETPCLVIEIGGRP